MKIKRIENIPPLKDPKQKEEQPRQDRPQNDKKSFEEVLKQAELQAEQNTQEKAEKIIEPELPPTLEISIHKKPKQVSPPTFSDIMKEELGDDKKK